MATRTAGPKPLATQPPRALPPGGKAPGPVAARSPVRGPPARAPAKAPAAARPPVKNPVIKAPSSRTSSISPARPAVQAPVARAPAVRTPARSPAPAPVARTLPAAAGGALGGYSQYIPTVPQGPKADNWINRAVQNKVSGYGDYAGGLVNSVGNAVNAVGMGIGDYITNTTRGWGQGVAGYGNDMKDVVGAGGSRVATAGNPLGMAGMGSAK